MTEILVSNSDKAMTFRRLNRTVPFLARPVRILCENGFQKKSPKFCRTVPRFLVLILHTDMAFYTMLVYRFLDNVYKGFFKNLCHVLRFNFLKVLFEGFLNIYACCNVCC